jgi:hypothetical protein
MQYGQRTTVSVSAMPFIYAAPEDFEASDVPPFDVPVSM